MVWGRGAVDMLNLTASQAVAFRRLADSGFTPKGTLVYLAVADEEALGTWGARWLVDHEWDAVAADYVLTESGGFQMPSPHGPRLPVMVAEKGTFWSKLHVRGTPGHGSQPFRTDNALVTAAEVVRRLAEYAADRGHRRGVAPPRRDDGLSRGDARRVPRPDAVRDYCRVAAGRHGSARARVHAHDLLAQRRPRRHQDQRRPRPRGARGRHPHAARAEWRRHPRPAARRARRPLRPVEIESNEDLSTASPIDTPLWDTLATVTGRLVRDSALVPFLMVGGTDNRFFRRAGAVGYGFGLFSKRLAFEDYATMFHGNDERVDVESLALSEQLWRAVAEEMLHE